MVKPLPIPEERSWTRFRDQPIDRDPPHPHLGGIRLADLTAEQVEACDRWLEQSGAALPVRTPGG